MQSGTHFFIKPEILAPAGDMNSLKAAVYNGANAVYLGGQNLNARRSADNFSKETLKEAVDFCCVRGVQVYYTLNTLLFDVEMDIAIQEIKTSYLAGVNAYIVSDLAVAKLVRCIAPNAKLHASTQMSVHTNASLKTLQKLGFSRVVLARELSKDEIIEIAKTAKMLKMELEVFVHGALCMSVSGQCYYSGVLGTRSGNRGLCAQPCRLPYTVGQETYGALSLKDLSLMEKLPELAELGVHSFKIEGRMKRYEYVATAVSSVCSALDNSFSGTQATMLENVFSRSGFTQGYFENRRGSEMFGTRKKEDVLATKEVLSSLQTLATTEQNKQGVDMYFTAKLNERAELAVLRGNLSASVHTDSTVQKAQKMGLTIDDVKKQLSKTGNTPFEVREMIVTLDDELFLPISALNKLRREALEILENKCSERPERTVGDYVFPLRKTYTPEKTDTHIRMQSFAQCPDDVSSIQRLYVPLSTLLRETIPPQANEIEIVVELPRVMFGRTRQVTENLATLKTKGITKALCNTLDAFCLARQADFLPVAGFGMNLSNTLALEEIEKLGGLDVILSTEMRFAAIKQLGSNTQRGLITYGRTPLMLMRNCPLSGNPDKGNCKLCDGYIIDRKNIQFPIVCDGSGYTEMLNSRPMYLADIPNRTQNIDFEVYYFTIESKSEVESVLQSYKAGESATTEFTRGLYERGVQ